MGALACEGDGVECRERESESERRVTLERAHAVCPERAWLYGRLMLLLLLLLLLRLLRSIFDWHTLGQISLAIRNVCCCHLARTCQHELTVVFFSFRINSIEISKSSDAFRFLFLAYIFQRLCPAYTPFSPPLTTLPLLRSCSQLLHINKKNITTKNNRV